MVNNNYVTLAANKVKLAGGEQLQLLDICHFGDNMQSVMKYLVEQHRMQNCIELEDRGQGFVDINEHFMTRSEAYKLAIKSKQFFIKKYVLPHKRLDSSCIRDIVRDPVVGCVTTIKINGYDEHINLVSFNKIEHYVVYDNIDLLPHNKTNEFIDFLNHNNIKFEIIKYNYMLKSSGNIQQ